MYPIFNKKIYACFGGNVSEDDTNTSQLLYLLEQAINNYNLFVMGNVYVKNNIDIPLLIALKRNADTLLECKDLIVKLHKEKNKEIYNNSDLLHIFLYKLFPYTNDIINKDVIKRFKGIPIYATWLDTHTSILVISKLRCPTKKKNGLGYITITTVNMQILTEEKDIDIFRILKRNSLYKKSHVSLEV